MDIEFSFIITGVPDRDTAEVIKAAIENALLKEASTYMPLTYEEI